MTPVFLYRYRDLLRERGVSAAQTPETRLDSEGRYELFYIPFEHVNREAQLVIVGITPGPNQIKLAYLETQRLLKVGVPDPDVLIAAKRIGAFGGPTMRPNLVKMLRAFGFSRILGLSDEEDLWGNAANLLHATSTVPNAAFKNGKMFAGNFEEIIATAVLRRSFERDFLGSLAEIDPGAIFVGLGKTPLDALDWCVAKGLLRSKQVLGAFAHPSTNGGSQVDIYLGHKNPDELHDNDPVRKRVVWLLSAAKRLEEATVGLTGTRQPVTMYRLESQAMVSVGGAKKSDIDEVGVRRREDHVTGGNMYSRPAINEAFARAGFRTAHETKKLTLYSCGSGKSDIYLKNEVKGIAIVVHPDAREKAVRAAEGRGTVGAAAYHNSNMTAFPLREHTGKNLIRYGYSVTFDTCGALEDFLIELRL